MAVLYKQVLKSNAPHINEQDSVKEKPLCYEATCSSSQG